MMEGTGLWGGGAAYTLKSGGRGALGEPTRDPIAGVCVSQETYWLQREMGKSFLPPCLLWFSLSLKTLSWAQLRASSWMWKEHHQQTWTLADPGHKPLCHLPCGSSLLSSICFWLWASLQALPPSDALVPHPWLGHDSSSSLVATNSPESPYWSGLQAMVRFKQ